MLTDTEIQDVVTAHLECAIWADWPDEDAANVAELSDEGIEMLRESVHAFVDDESIGADLRLWADTFGAGQIGHDLWLTRNRHGAGFWARDTSGGPVTAAGRRLTDAAHAMGPLDLYFGDDDKVHVA